MEVTRRRLLAGTGALAALATVSLSRAHWPLGPLDSPFLGAAPRRTLIAALEALIPDPSRGERLAAGVDAFLATSDPLQGADLRMALVVLEHGGLRRFSRLDLEARVERLKAWESSGANPKRMIFQALRRLAMFSYYSDPDTWDAFGYEGTWIKE